MNYRGRFRVFMLTLALGIASVGFASWFERFVSEVQVDLPQTQSAEIYEIITKRNWIGFEEIGHGCGGRNRYGAESSVTGYQTADFRKVSLHTGGYDNRRDALREVRLRIIEAKIIINDSAAAKNTQHEPWTRRVAIEANNKGKSSFEIIRYDGNTVIVLGIWAGRPETEKDLTDKLRSRSNRNLVYNLGYEFCNRNKENL